MSKHQTIAEYYAGKTVFITGATGFLGKVLIEKLLRCCPDVRLIYVLVRTKRGLAAQDRILSMLEEPLFAALRGAQPDFAGKVHVIAGDILLPGLGLSTDDTRRLHDEVQVVFHSAATLKFDEPLRLAIDMNVLGVRKVVKLCKEMSKLEVLCHVSTAYANCDRTHIDEEIYPPPIEPHKLITALEWLDDEMITLITPRLIAGKPNTYTYTKQLAEWLLAVEGKDLPVAIVRPSIVTAAWKEPLPGWIDNLNGPSGLYIAAGKGIMRSMKAGHDEIADLIPVDCPVNMMLASVWHVAVHRPPNMQVYHVTSGGINPITWGEQAPVVVDYYKRNPLELAFRRPRCAFTRNDLLHDYWILVSHLVPAYAYDAAARLVGKKPRMVLVYQKLHRAMSTLEWFTMRSWSWSHHNTEVLRGVMTPEDSKVFYVDPRGLDWPSYLENYCRGAKQFILKEDVTGLPSARAHMKRLRNLRYAFNTCLVVLLWRILVARSHIARNSWSFILGLVFKFVRFFRLTSTVSSN